MATQKKLGIVRKVNRPRGAYACPYHKGYVSFLTKKELREHIACKHLQQVELDAHSSDNPDAL